MYLTVVSIYDAKAQAYGRPAFVQTRGSAIRSFSDEVNRKSPDNLMSQHPEDFTLFHLGTFDDQDATFDVIRPPEQLANGSAVLVEVSG